MKKIFLFLIILIISANLVSAALVAHYSFDGDYKDGGPDAIIYDSSGTDPPNDGTFNKNTKLLMSFDNQDAKDESGYGNDGKHYGNTRLLMSFDDVTPPTIQDESDYGNVGTINGILDCNVDGKSGKACSFDGDDKVTIPYSSAFDMEPGQHRTVAFWAKRNTVISSGEVLFQQGLTHIAFRDGTYGGLMVTTINASGGNHYTKTRVSGILEDINDLEWHHYAFVWDKNSLGLKIYFDGAPVNCPFWCDWNVDVSQENWTRTDNAFISPYNQFNGDIDELVVYSKPLLPDEIVVLRDAQKAKFIDIKEDSPSERSGDYSFEFDGIDDKVEITSPDLPTGQQPRTILAWVKQDVRTTYAPVVAYGIKAGGRGWQFGFSGATGKLTLGVFGDNKGQSTDVVPLNQWTQVGIVYDGTSVTYYIDGSPSGTSVVGSIDTATTYARIGHAIPGWDGVDGGYKFKGRIDEVAVYSKALSSDEIWDLFELKKAKFTDWTTDTPEDIDSDYALEFDGVNDYIEISQDVMDFNYDAFTVTLWTSPKTFVFDSGFFTEKDFDNGVDIRVRGSELTATVRLEDGTQIQTFDNIPTNAIQPNGGWRHIAVTFDSESLTTYVDGNLEDDVPTGGSRRNYDRPLWIGRGGTSTSKYWNGIIDEVKIYDEALSPEQIENEYSRGNAYWRPPPPPERWGAPGFIPNLFVILTVISTLLLLSYLNIRK